MNMNAGGLLFFALFAMAQVGMYLSIRREWFSPVVTAGGGVLISVILSSLMSIAARNSLAQAFTVGLLLGGLISGLTLAIAWYFHKNEMHQKQRADT